MSFWEFIKYCFWCLFTGIEIGSAPGGSGVAMTWIDCLVGIATFIVIVLVVVAIIVVVKKIIIHSRDKNKK